MWRFSLFGIPFGVEPWFWINAALLGGGLYSRTSAQWQSVALWVAVVFISIVIHELGHAFAGRQFGAAPVIRLHAWGGLTYLPGRPFNRRQNILVSAAGPAAGFVFGVLVLVAAILIHPKPPLLLALIGDALYINFFWTCINLLPIQPLDGGHIFRDLLGPRRQGWVALTGTVCAGAVAVWALKEYQIFLALFFGYLAYQNFQHHWTGGGIVTD